MQKMKYKYSAVLFAILVVILVGRPKLNDPCIQSGLNINPTQFCCPGLSPVMNNFQFRCESSKTETLPRLTVLGFEEFTPKVGIKSTKVSWKHYIGADIYQVIRIANNLRSPLGYVIPGNLDKIFYADETDFGAAYQVIGYADNRVIAVSDILESSEPSDAQLTLKILEIDAIASNYKKTLQTLALVTKKSSDIRLKKKLTSIGSDLNAQVLSLGSNVNSVFPRYSSTKINQISRNLLGIKINQRNKKATIIKIVKNFDTVLFRNYKTLKG